MKHEHASESTAGISVPAFRSPDLRTRTARVAAEVTARRDRIHRSCAVLRTLAVMMAVPLGASPRAQDVWPAGPPLPLTEALARALETHPSVAFARAVRDATSASVREAESARMPSVAADAHAIRFAEPMVVAPIHSFNPTRPPSFDRTLAQANFSVDYTLFDGGARGRRIEGARALEAGAAASEAGTLQALLVDVTRAYLQVASARDVVDARDRQVEALEGEKTRAERLLAQGRAPRVAVLRADAALNAAAAERVAAEAQAHVAEQQLARLMGATVDVVAQRAVRIPDVPTTDDIADRERSIASASAHNAELSRGRSRLAAAEAATGVARAARLPSVRLGGRWAEYGGSESSFTGEWQGGVQVGFPVFTGGARTAAIDRADAEAAVARTELRIAELRIADAVDGALAALSASDARTTALGSAVAQYEEVVRIEKLALESGAGLQTDYLSAEAELARARAALTEARAARILARVELARVAGELTRDWLSRNVESQ